ncbi:MAG: hypothetical protein Q7S06_03355 [Nanoarchaeota archaeon]|nr:hypothetical protein [Nanoarchaeota archaeon]
MRKPRLGLTGLAFLALTAPYSLHAQSAEKAPGAVILSGTVVDEAYESTGDSSVYAFILETSTGERKLIEIREGVGDGVITYPKSVDLLVNKGTRIRLDLRKIWGNEADLNQKYFSLKAGNFMRYAEIN